MLPSMTAREQLEERVKRSLQHARNCVDGSTYQPSYHEACVEHLLVAVEDPFEIVRERNK